LDLTQARHVDFISEKWSVAVPLPGSPGRGGSRLWPEGEKTCKAPMPHGREKGRAGTQGCPEVWGLAMAPCSRRGATPAGLGMRFGAERLAEQWSQVLRAALALCTLIGPASSPGLSAPDLYLFTYSVIQQTLNVPIWCQAYMWETSEHWVGDRLCTM
jgi:hypothetical protein